jgi:hypothetical protein
MSACAHQLRQEALCRVSSGPPVLSTTRLPLQFLLLAAVLLICLLRTGGLLKLRKMNTPANEM